MRGAEIGDAMCLVNSIDREGRVVKVSGKSDDFWSRSLGRTVEGLPVGEVVWRILLAKCWISIAFLEIIRLFSR